MTTDVLNPVACAADYCDHAPEVRGLCRLHYQRLRKHGSLTLPDALDRVLQKVVLDGFGCWLWIAYLNPAGYGQFGDNGAVHLAHRWIYEYLVEPIPEGLTLDHLCRNRACVNPDHLEPVTVAENIRRAAAVRDYGPPMEVCANGHAMTAENSYKRRGRRNSLACKTCQREASRRHYWRKREATA